MSKKGDDIRTKSQVKKKLRDAKHKYLTKRYRDKLTQCPSNCTFNYRHTTVDEESGKEVEIGLCMYGAENPEEWPGMICDDVQTAEQCPYFSCRHDKESIRKEFDEELQDDFKVAHHYKDIAALQWVLKEKVYSWDLAWYQRLWIMMLFQIYAVSRFLRKAGLN